jgi:hypothetical protein
MVGRAELLLDAIRNTQHAFANDIHIRKEAGRKTASGPEELAGYDNSVEP